MEQENKSAIVSLLKVQGLLSFAFSLGGIFLQVFLFSLGGFDAVVRYNLISCISLFFCCIFSGWFLQRFSTKRLMLGGLSAFALMFLLLFIMRERGLMILPLLGLLNGIGLAGFWSVMNLAQFALTSAEMRHRYFGRQNFWSGIAYAAGPMIGGAFISAMGILVSREIAYSLLFFSLFLLMVLVYREAMKLPAFEGIRFSLRHILRHRRSREWKLALVQYFFYGLYDFSFAAFSAVLMFVALKHEIVLGAVNAFSAIAAAVAALMAGVLLKQTERIYLLGLVFAPLGIFLFGFSPTWMGIAALIVLTRLFQPLLDLASAKTNFDILDRTGNTWQEIYHFFVEHEIVLNLGRIISFSFFLWFMERTQDAGVARLWIMGLAAVILAIGFLQGRLMQKIRASGTEVS